MDNGRIYMLTNQSDTEKNVFICQSLKKTQTLSSVAEVILNINNPFLQERSNW